MNTDLITKLLRDFYNVTSFKTCMYDEAGREKCYFPQKFTPFCEMVHSVPELADKCENCDRLLIEECRRRREQYVHVCHAGLTECASPVVFKGEIIGFIATGQIRSAGKDEPDPTILKEFGDRAGELTERYGRLPVADEEKILSAIRILDACAGYEKLKSLIIEGDGLTVRRIRAFIDENLAEDLSVPALCAEFSLSRSDLYAVFRESFSATPAEYVKDRRLKKACSLLAGDDMKINEVAAACGVPDYNYFSKVFKRATGVTPRNYRKQAHGRNARPS